VFQFDAGAPAMSSAVAQGLSLDGRSADMVIVAGHLVVPSEERDAYLGGCIDVVAQARQAKGCLDFSIAADLVEPDRVNVFERWESQAAVAAFRGSGPSGEQMAVITSASVVEYDVANERPLT
jgi:quinol monooxygenase YgiN